MKNNFFLLCFLAIFFIACSNETQNEEQLEQKDQPSFSQGKDISFSLKFINGETLLINSSNQKFSFENTYKARMFVFFTSWCLPCKAQMPHLNKLYDKYKDRFEVIGVALENISMQDMQKFINEEKIQYPVSLGENNFVFSKVLNINSLPMMVLFDAKGEKIKEYLGLIPEEMLDIDIQKVMM